MRDTTKWSNAAKGTTLAFNQRLILQALRSASELQHDIYGSSYARGFSQEDECTSNNPCVFCKASVAAHELFE